MKYIYDLFKKYCHPMTEKLDLLRHLHEETFIRLQPSGIHGTGVFAIRDIPRQEVTIFFFFSDSEDEWIHLTYSDVGSRLHPVNFLIETYCLFRSSWIFCPSPWIWKNGLSFSESFGYAQYSLSEWWHESFVAPSPPCRRRALVDYGTIVQE